MNLRVARKVRKRLRLARLGMALPHNYRHTTQREAYRVTSHRWWRHTYPGARKQLGWTP